MNPLGTLEDRPVVAAQLTGASSAGFQLRPLRGAFGLLSEELFGLTSYAVQIVEWDRTPRNCGRCAALTAKKGPSKTCPNCGLTVYPRVAPVVMVLVMRGEGEGRELLARGPHFPLGMY